MVSYQENNATDHRKCLFPSVKGRLDDANMKMKQKIDDVFKFDVQEDTSLDLKSFCKLLKKSCL